MIKKFKEALKGFIQDHYTKDSYCIEQEEYSKYYNLINMIEYRLKRTRGKVKKTLEEELEIAKNELNEKREAKEKKSHELMAFLEEKCCNPFVQSYLKQSKDLKVYDLGIFRRSLYLKPDGIYLGNLKFVSKCGFTGKMTSPLAEAGWMGGSNSTKRFILEL